MLAVENGHVESTVHLIRNNAIVNARDTDGRTALHRGVSRYFVYFKISSFRKFRKPKFYSIFSSFYILNFIWCEVKKDFDWCW